MGLVLVEFVPRVVVPVGGAAPEALVRAVSAAAAPSGGVLAVGEFGAGVPVAAPPVPGWTVSGGAGVRLKSGGGVPTEPPPNGWF